MKLQWIAFSVLLIAAPSSASSFERVYELNGRWYSVASHCVPVRHFGGATDQRQFGDAADQRQFGDAADQRQFGDAVDQRQFGDAADQRQFGDAADQRQFGDAADQRQFGDAADQRQFGDAADQRQFGDAADRRQFGGAEDQRNFGEAADDRAFGSDEVKISCEKNDSDTGFVLLGLPLESQPKLRDARIGELHWEGRGWMILTDRETLSLY